MKPSNPALLALLASRQFYAVDLFVFTLLDGTVLRYCAGDQDITYGGNTYTCGGQTGPYFQREGERGLCSWKTGVEVSTLQFTVIPGSSTVEGMAFLQACKLGFFDGATMIMYRAFMPTYGDTSAGLVNVFSGIVVEIDAGRTAAIFNVNSFTEILNQQMPRNMYQPGCLNTLYDAGCTLNRASFAVNSSVASGSTVSHINASLAQATTEFDQGTVEFTSGQNAGFKRTVKQFITGGYFTLLVPLPFTPAVSDTFTIYPGCNKTMNRCSGRFSNLANFRGHPYVPSPETGV